MTEEEAVQYYVDKLESVFIEGSPAKDVAAIVFEPVQGEGGFIPAPIEWVKAVRKICDDHGIMMVCDEVQTGWARSGRMFVSNYYEEAGCPPDILVTAKSIAGGLPLSAVTARKEVMDGVVGGTIGGTYCGNAVACASGIALLDIMIKEDYPAKARKIAERCMSKFNQWKEKYEVVGDVRGVGAMMGVEFVKNQDTKEPNSEIVTAIVNAAVQKGLLLEGAGTYNNVIRFLCPLCVTDEQLEAGLAIYEEVLDELAK
jgi:4-aminobutyrate aminotransferase/(S)-3-amino-2-methylpropionate transaminase